MINKYMIIITEITFKYCITFEYILEPSKPLN